ncbi:MAG: methyltransferase domain-containing protein [Actinomycetales bacterium]|nr:MAG: methyltransferase domain-containing protein [Actinomycetales bacterium]
MHALLRCSSDPGRVGRPYQDHRAVEGFLGTPHERRPTHYSRAVHPRVKALVRPTVLAVNTPVAARRARRELDAAARPLKLEIGGHALRPGWVVTNVGPTTRLYLDATSTWPLEDASVSHIYSDNVIEHIPLVPARTLFSEAYRCLQPGGAIRFVTPDLRAHVDRYLAGQSPKGDPEAAVYEESGLTVEHPLDWIRIPIASFEHHLGYVYDFDALKLELERAGFTRVTRCELNQSDHPGLAGLDLRAAEGGAQMAVEATR